MKKLLFVCLLTATISTAGFAQGFQQKTPAERAADLKSSLALNDDQTAKITAIYTVRAKSMDSLMIALNGDFGSMREKMTPITTSTNAKVKALLTPEQAAAFQKQQDAAAERMKQMMQGGGGAPPQR